MTVCKSAGRDECTLMPCSRRGSLASTSSTSISSCTPFDVPRIRSINARVVAGTVSDASASSVAPAITATGVRSSWLAMSMKSRSRSMKRSLRARKSLIALRMTSISEVACAGICNRWPACSGRSSPMLRAMRESGSTSLDAPQAVRAPSTISRVNPAPAMVRAMSRSRCSISEISRVMIFLCPPDSRTRTTRSSPSSDTSSCTPGGKAASTSGMSVDCPLWYIAMSRVFLQRYEGSLAWRSSNWSSSAVSSVCHTSRSACSFTTRPWTATAADSSSR